MKGHGKDLSDAGELGAHEPACARTDVTFHAVDARVWGCLIGGKLRGYHRVTGLPAELGGIHVFLTAVRSSCKDEDVQKGCRSNDEGRTADHRLAKIDRRINVQNLALRLGLTASQPNADRNEQQAKDENSRQNQEKEEGWAGPESRNS